MLRSYTLPLTTAGMAVFRNQLEVSLPDEMDIISQACMHEEMGRWPWDPFASPTKPASAGQTDASVQGGAARYVHTAQS
jgi:hypothetical protein